MLNSHPHGRLYLYICEDLYLALVSIFSSFLLSLASLLRALVVVRVFTARCALRGPISISDFVCSSYGF